MQEYSVLVFLTQSVVCAREYILSCLKSAHSQSSTNLILFQVALFTDCVFLNTQSTHDAAFSTIHSTVNKYSGITAIRYNNLKKHEQFEHLPFKVLTTTQPSYLHNLITVQPPHSTRSSSLVTLAPVHQHHLLYE